MQTGNPRRNPIVAGGRRRSGDSTVDDVTTRQTRQKVSRSVFLAGAYKPLPGSSSPAARRCHTQSYTHTQDCACTFAHLHPCTHVHTHALALMHIQTVLIMQAKMCTNSHLNKHHHAHPDTHSSTHTHTQSYYLCRSRHGVLEIKAGQGVIWYLRLLHAHALDSHQRHVPHFSSALAS